MQAQAAAEAAQTAARRQEKLRAAAETAERYAAARLGEAHVAQQAAEVEARWQREARLMSVSVREELKGQLTALGAAMLEVKPPLKPPIETAFPSGITAELPLGSCGVIQGRGGNGGVSCDGRVRDIGCDRVAV